MPATLRRPATGTPSASNSTNAAQRLRLNFAAVRVSFTWLGVRKTLSTEQKALAAEQFGAEGQYLSAAKKLIDTKHEAFQAVSSVRNQIISCWKGMSLPYPEPGTRLIKQDEVDRFNERMIEFREELAAAVRNLNGEFESLKAAARERLGSLYNPDDYPDNLRNLFAVEWDFPSVEPPEYLLRLNPHLYQQERQRISARFDEAVKLAEEAFVAEFSKLVAHLTERLTAGVDGERKIFRDSAITNLTEFFNRFRSLNVRSNADLDRLVETARQVITGADPHIVRNSESLRQQVSAQLASVQAGLDQMLVDQPRRRILRGQSTHGSSSNAEG